MKHPGKLKPYQINYLADNWNRLLFDNRLDFAHTSIKLVRQRELNEIMGEPFPCSGVILADSRSADIYLVKYYCKSDWHIFHSTLAHELIHLFQAQNNMELKHKCPTFKHYARIAQYHYGIKV